MHLETGQEQGNFPFAFWEIFHKNCLVLIKNLGLGVIMALSLSYFMLYDTVEVFGANLIYH